MTKKYVSFEEALKASVEGKEVWSWLEPSSRPYHKHSHGYEQVGSVRLYKFNLLGAETERFNELKWTIQEDK